MYKEYSHCRREKACLSLLLFFLFFRSIANAEIVDQIAAVVNEDAITVSELEKETTERYNAAALQNGNSATASSLERLRGETLDSIIDRKLLEQRAEKMNITVTEAEVDRAFAEQVLRSGMPRELFINEMHKVGLSEKTYRQNLHASLLQGKLVNIEVQSKVVITDEMIEKYYKKNYISHIDSKIYKLRQMGFVWGVDSDGRERSREKALQLARKVRADVLIGKNFSELAKKYSDLPSAADGGDIGDFTLEDMAQTMASTVKDLRPSEVSKIIETNSSYQFYQLVSFKNHLTVVKNKLEDVREEIRKRLYQKKLRQAYNDWISGLKESAYIKKLH